MSSESEPDEFGYDVRTAEAAAQAADPERYAALKKLTHTESHPCPVKGCRLSAEEHHRLAFGVFHELRALKQRVRELEEGRTE
jgi:hypothetical protein